MMGRAGCRTALLLVVALGSMSCAGRLSAIGESCTRTADCTLVSRCVQQECVEGPEESTDGAKAVRRNAFKTLEGLAKAVVAAVKTGHSKNLRALLMTGDDLEAFRRTLPPKIGEDPATTTARWATERRRYEETLSKFGGHWAKLVAAAGRFGVPLSSLRFSRVGEHRERMVDHVKLAQDLKIHVTSDGARPVKVEVELCVKTHRGWQLVSPEVELELAE